MFWEKLRNLSGPAWPIALGSHWCQHYANSSRAVNLYTFFGGTSYVCTNFNVQLTIWWFICKIHKSAFSIYANSQIHYFKSIILQKFGELLLEMLVFNLKVEMGLADSVWVSLVRSCKLNLRSLTSHDQTVPVCLCVCLSVQF